MERTSTEMLLIRTIVAGFWAIALVVWWATLWLVDAYARVGADLPGATVVAKEAAGSGVPFGIAAVLSAVTVYAMLRHANRALLVSAGLLCVATALTLIAMFTITLPVVHMCGQVVPGWPSLGESIGPHSGGAVGCRPR